ncbi:MAG: DUF6132 family protein [Bacillota bacterium]
MRHASVILGQGGGSLTGYFLHITIGPCPLSGNWEVSL